MSRFLRVWMGVLSALLLGSCGGGGDATAPAPGEATSIDIVGGDGQSAVVASRLDQALAVRVKDADGRAVPGAQVRFEVTAGGGSLFVDAATSDPDGTARTFWTLGVRAGEPQQVEARIDLGTGQVALVRFGADALAGPFARLAAVQGDNQKALPDSRLPLDLVIEARDAWNNPLPGVHVESGTASSGLVVPSEAVTGTDGRATFVWTLGPSLGQQSVDVRATASAGIVVLASAVQALETDPQSIEFTSTQPAVAIQHDPAYAWFIARIRPGAAGRVVEFGPGEGSPAFGPMRATTDSQGTAIYRGAIHVAGRISIVARTGTAVSAPIVSDVAPSPHAYDGFYQCSGLGIPTERVVIRQGVVTVDTMPDFTTASGTLDESSGQVDLQLTYRPGFVYRIQGTIVLDALQNASAALPYRLTSPDPTVEPAQEVWNCTRA